MKGKVRNNILLMMTAFIWGSSFVAQSAGMDYIGPFTFNSVRCLMGAAVLLPVIKFLDRQKKTGGRIEKDSEKGQTEPASWGLLLWCYSGSGEFLAAGGYSVYRRGKSGLYHSIVYSDCTGYQNIPWKKSGV